MLLLFYGQTLLIFGVIWLIRLLNVSLGFGRFVVGRNGGHGGLCDVGHDWRFGWSDSVCRGCFRGIAGEVKSCLARLNTFGGWFYTKGVLTLNLNNFG
jgi:hypothetical protein